MRKVVATVGVIIMSVGIITNSGVLAVLLHARRQFGSSVHTLITNQCAMELYTCLFLLPSFVMMLTGGYHYNSSADNNCYYSYRQPLLYLERQMKLVGERESLTYITSKTEGGLPEKAKAHRAGHP